MLQCHDVQTRSKTAGWKRECGQVGDNIEFAVVPLRIANGQVDCHVPLPGEVLRMDALACTGIEDEGTGW